MRVQNCFYPKVFKNPYTGEQVTARCGKCPACLNTRASNWVTRLDLEAHCHKYVLFTTLTFDEQHVAQIIRLPYDNNSIPTYIDSSTGEYFDFSDLQLRPSDVQYLKEHRYFNVLQKRDFQLFIKRLRYYFDKTEKGALLRYFLCGEIGPTTFRPHGHLLLFFDSEKCASEIELLLRKSWSDEHKSLLGNIYDPHFVSGSASSYCASYLNSVTQLPRNYLHKAIRPFTLFSKHPAIGTLFPPLREVKELFDYGDIKFTYLRESSNTFETSYFWRSFASRLYPRCQRFGMLSSDERKSLYRLVEEFSPTLTNRQIARRLKREYIDSGRDSFFSRYFREIAYKKKKGVHFISQSASVTWNLKNLPFLPKDVVFERPFTAIKDFVKEYNENSLISFVNVISRVRHQAQIFGVSINDYVSKIEKYYENVNKHRLIDDYLYQDRYFSCHPRWHIIYFDKSFYDKVTQTDYLSWSLSTKEYLNNLFDSLPLKEVSHPRGDVISVLDIPPLDSLPDFMSFKLLHNKISHDLTKQKKNNDYSLSKKDRFGKVLDF